MERKRFDVVVLLALAALLVGVSAIYLLTAPRQAATSSSPSARVQASVDEGPLEQARALGGLAKTADEQHFASEATKLADEMVDLQFSAAIRHAGDQPGPRNVDHEAQQRVAAKTAQVAADQNAIADIRAQLARAPSTKSGALREQLELAHAQLDLHKAELEDAQQDLARSGNDTRATIQRLLDEHETLEHSADARKIVPGEAAPQAPDGLVARVQAWQQLSTKAKLIARARADCSRQIATVSALHDALEAEVDREQQATAKLQPGTPRAQAHSAETTAAALSSVRHLQEDQKTLSEFDQRLHAEQQLADVYAKWAAAVSEQRRAAVHVITESLFWIVLILIAAFVVERIIIQNFFDGFNYERKRLMTFRHIVRFVCEASALLLVLVALFGHPQQMTTIVGLAGAGLTVALQDPILSILGWFSLMGRHGMSIGDRVEINGVGGEVVEIGLLRTVILETGNWTDAGHPTGRQVSFANSFAVRGYFFNFSTRGQWLWDEVCVRLPQGADPQKLAQQIERLAAAETESDAKLAEEEWKRLARPHSLRTVPTTPVVEFKPASDGVDMVVRYITRAQERHTLRSRLYRAIVQSLHEDAHARARSAGSES